MGKLGKADAHVWTKCMCVSYSKRERFAKKNTNAKDMQNTCSRYKRHEQTTRKIKHVNADVELAQLQGLH